MRRLFWVSSRRAGEPPAPDPHAQALAADGAGLGAALGDDGETARVEAVKHCEGDEECIDGLPSRWQPMAAKVLSEINGLHAGREALRDELREHVRTEDERQKNFEELLHGHVLEADRVYRPLLRETRAAVDRIAERSITRDDLFRAMRWIGALITAMVAALGWMFANVDELHTFVHRVFT